MSELCRGVAIVFRVAGTNIQCNWLLPCMGVFGTCVDTEIAHDLTPKRAAGNHAFNGFAQHARAVPRVFVIQQIAGGA